MSAGRKACGEPSHCGAASAIAAKLAVEKYGSRSVIVYCDTMRTEHPSNLVFFDQIATWLDRQITVIRSDKYKTVEDVWRQRRYMAGPAGAPCTVEMKKIPRFQFQHCDDLNIFGFTLEETSRIRRFEENNPELFLEWNLRDAGITKTECFRRLRTAGIELPVLYTLGFKNNNCLGCVKATSPKYWNMVRQHFPAVFDRRAQLSRELNARLVRYKGQRIFLGELPANASGRLENITCGPECGQ